MTPDPATPDQPTPDRGPWVIVVQAEPGEVPAAVRLKQWLKAGLRRFGLRVIHAGLREEREVVYVELPKQKGKRPGAEPERSAPGCLPGTPKLRGPR